MAKYSTKEILTPGFQMPSDYNELVSVYRSLAKTADQRLVRLESYAHDPNMGDVLKWSYARAQKDIQNWSGKEATRFNTAPPEKKQSLLAKIRDIQTFLESPTSTKAGIKSVYMERAKTLNERYGTNLTWQNIGEFFESDMFNDLVKKDKLDSGTLLRAIAALRKDKNSTELKVAKEINVEANKETKDKKVIRVEGDKILQNAIDMVTKDYSDEVKEFLK